MECPECKREYPEGCEQTVAISKRGKCIACIIEDPNEPRIQMEPYEFETTEEYKGQLNFTRTIPQSLPV